MPNDGTALRIDSQDNSMQLLADPVLVEDIQFAGDLPERTQEASFEW